VKENVGISPVSVIRKPAVAGMFYPEKPKSLEREIEEFYSNVSPLPAISKAKGLVIPHAGYVYSGQTAAFGFKSLDVFRIKTVIVLSPSHREYFQGICIYDGDGYETPLGIVPVNKEKVEQLTENSKHIFCGKHGHQEEHAVEVILPFLQVLLPKFDFVPVVMGDQEGQYINALAEALPKALDDNTIIITSSDLSHYYNKQTAKLLDDKVASAINAYDFQTLQTDLQTGACQACGGGLIVSMMKALAPIEGRKMSVLRRSDSGDVSGDNRQVVGYLSAAVHF
jgi:AmmeMemoRadiSam system protein B